MRGGGGGASRERQAGAGLARPAQLQPLSRAGLELEAAACRGSDALLTAFCNGPRDAETPCSSRFETIT